MYVSKLTKDDCQQVYWWCQWAGCWRVDMSEKWPALTPRGSSYTPNESFVGFSVVFFLDGGEFKEFIWNCFKIKKRKCFIPLQFHDRKKYNTSLASKLTYRTQGGLIKYTTSNEYFKWKWHCHISLWHNTTRCQQRTFQPPNLVKEDFHSPAST